jgi:hypothetical protein
MKNNAKIVIAAVQQHGLTLEHAFKEMEKQRGDRSSLRRSDSIGSH